VGARSGTNGSNPPLILDQDTTRYQRKYISTGRIKSLVLVPPSHSNLRTRASSFFFNRVFGWRAAGAERSRSAPAAVWMGSSRSGAAPGGIFVPDAGSLRPSNFEGRSRSAPIFALRLPPVSPLSARVGYSGLRQSPTSSFHPVSCSFFLSLSHLSHYPLVSPAGEEIGGIVGAVLGWRRGAGGRGARPLRARGRQWQPDIPVHGAGGGGILARGCGGGGLRPYDARDRRWRPPWLAHRARPITVPPVLLPFLISYIDS
jgi:hypothetical protein